MAEAATAAAKELCDATVVSEDAAARFLADFPLPALVDALTACAPGSEEEQSLCGALDRVFATRVGADALPSALAFASAGTQAQSDGVRAFAARQLGRLLLADPVAYGDAALPPLVALLGDESTPAAAAALSSLAAAASTAGGLAAALAPGAGLQTLATHADATVRLRVCELAARVAAAGPVAASAVAEAGLFSGLLAELDRGKPPCRDVLAALAALETLSALLESPDAAAGLGSSALGVLPRLLTLASAADGAETLVRARALIVCARILSARAAETGVTTAAVLSAIGEALAPDHAPPGVLPAAVEAVSVLGESASGAELAAQSPPGLLHLVAPLAVAGGSGALSSPLSQSAAHALATVAGAERSPAEALLSSTFEAALHAAVHDALACAAGAPTLAELLWAALRRRGQAFVEDRVAAYRLMCGLARRQWGANEVCAHAELLDALLDTRGETGHRACTWRHAAVCALAATFEAAVGLDDDGAAHCTRLLAAARAGTYGEQARSGAAVPQVALM